MKMLRLFSKRDVTEKAGFIDDFMKNFFVFSGIWRSKVDHRYNLFVAFFNLTVLLLGFLSISYMLILKYDDIDVNTEILLHFVEMFHSICTLVMFITKKEQISRLAEDVNENFDQSKLPDFDRQGCLGILQKERKNFQMVMRVACFAILSIYFSIIIDSSSLINKKKKIPYPSWFPFPTGDDHLFFYCLATAFQVVIYVEMLCVDLAVAGLWYATINKVSGLLTILGLTLQNVAQDRLEQGLMGAGKDAKQTKEFQKKFRQFIELHIYIMRLIRDLNSSTSIIFLEVVLTSQIAICFSGYHVSQAVTTGDKTRFIKFFSGVIVFVMMLLVYCASGQRLKNKSEKLFETLYDCEWYERSATFQRSLFFCQTISRKPLMIQQIMSADLHTFMSSIRTVFSYLNVLLALKDKT